MAGFLQIFIPQERKFYTFFEKASGNLHDISKVLVEMVNTTASDRRRELIKEIERLEHIGDGITHEIFSALGTHFITPFDREDIHSLVSSLDDVVDFIHGSAKRIELYKVEHLPPAVVKLAELILQAAQELHVAVAGLRHMKDTNQIKQACVKINSIENHADDIFDMTIASLFEEEKDAVKIIKMKEILSALETATDKCEDAANVLESIMVKNA